MTNAPAVPVPSWWGGTTSTPDVLDPCTHQSVPPPEVECCVDRLLYSWAVPTNPWVIDHNRGKIPASVEVISDGNRLTDSKVDHTSVNQTVVTHTTPFAGYVILLV
jgi:hypothetical protein